MTEVILDNINSLVKPGDEFYHLGDFCWGSPATAIKLLKRINGKKFMIMGNHDKVFRRADVAANVEWVKDLYGLTVQDPDAPQRKRYIVLCHYPLLSWAQKNHGSWHLHGHCHGKINEANVGQYRLDVGVDSHNFKPLSYDEIKEIMARVKAPKDK
jgi:calcineurin-like phosphoesterase family protein